MYCHIKLLIIFGLIDGLTVDITGDLESLTPPPSGPASLNEVTSNTTFIDIIWEPSDFAFSDVFYQVEISLTPALESLKRSFVMENVRTQPSGFYPVGGQGEASSPKLQASPPLCTLVIVL